MEGILWTQGLPSHVIVDIPGLVPAQEHVSLQEAGIVKLLNAIEVMSMNRF